MKLKVKVISVAAACICVAACGHPSPVEATSEPASARAAITIMTFNVENLFDTRHDAGKNDLTYLPLQQKQNEAHQAACAKIEVERWRDQCRSWDWSEAVLEKKMRAVAGAILQVDDGRGPDIVALQEVENVSVLERLRKVHLQAAGYLPAILIEGRDERGIDVAFLSRLPLAAEPVLHDYDATGLADKRAADTRGILQATFQMPDGSLLTGFSVHFPAPYHPTEMRVTAYQQLSRLKRLLPPDHYVFAAGDFNTTSEEVRNRNMLERFAYPDWTVAHELGCGGCRGTQYYARGDSWSFLDMILWSPAASRGKKTTWKIAADSVRVANRGPGQVTTQATPARFELPDGTGVSDHWPLVLSIELN